MHSISLDIHAATFTSAIWNSQGKLMRCLSRPTSAANLIDMVNEVPGPRQLVVEESHLAQWVKDTLERYVDRLIICDPKQNHWIARDDHANDQSSAVKLGKLLLGEYIKPIVHPDQHSAELRSLFLHYFDLNQQVVRFKCKAKSKYRQVGIRVAGAKIYDERNRDEWLGRLDDQPAIAHQARHLLDLLGVLETMKKETFTKVVKKIREHPAYPLLQGIPGVGPVIACGYITLIDTPHRFSRRNKLWRYACLGNRYHQSDDIVYHKGASKSGNRILKWVVYQHFQGAVQRTRTTNAFKASYEEAIRRGLTRSAARRHICRSLLSTVRAIWLKGEPYRERLPA
jgi:transposase